VNLTDFSIKRPIGILMIVCIIMLLGFVSVTRLPLDLFPTMDLPYAAVLTTYSGAGPQEVENLVSKPLEEILGTVQNLKNIYSISSEGSSMVGLEFEYGTNMDFATLQMREKIDIISTYLPNGIDKPMVVKADPTMMPVMAMSLSGARDINELQSIAEDVIKPRLERIEGVASVYIDGGLSREIKVEVDPSRLLGYGLSIDRVSQALMLENTNLPGGTIDDGQREFLIRTVGEFKTVDDIKSIPVALPTGAVIKLSDVADVTDTFKERSTYSRLNGTPSLSITVQKQTSANTVKVARLVENTFDELKKQLPENVTTETAFSQADFINWSISNVAQNAVIGGILAVLVLYIFLRNFRTTLIIGLSIPISIIATFILIYYNNLSLNIISLGGLALGVGMLVDNSIVVLENIFRFREAGYSREESASLGTAEVSGAITASTVTTIVVFLPVVFVSGLVSQIFREMALTVTFSLLASLAVSLTLIPTLSSRLLKINRTNGSNGNNGNGNGFISKISRKVSNMLENVNARYGRALAWSLTHRKWVVILAAITFIMSFVMLPFVKMEFIPSSDQGQFSISIEMPNGTKLDDTNQVAVEVERALAQIPEVETYMATVGGSGSMGGMGGGGSANLASFNVNLVKKEERSRGVSEIIEELRQQTDGIAGADINFSEPQVMGGGMGGGALISIEIKGEEFYVLKQIADDIAEKLRNIEGTREVKTSLEEGRPELQIVVNRDKASELGLSASQIASAVSTAVKGQVATRFKVEGEEIDVRVIVPESFRRNLQSLKDLMITTPLGVSVPLDDLADLKRDTGPLNIERINQVRVVSVNSNLVGRDIGSVSREIQSYFDGMKLPSGYTVEMGGQQREMVNAFTSLFLALLLAIALVYMVMAFQFESLVHPFTIMFSVPLALFGVVFSLVVTGRSLSVPSFIGVIMLAGIVVNNAIVLISYINTLRENGLNRDEAILKAGPTRLRPILMTTLTTVLGLVPMALGIGSGAEMSAPMATVVIGGLTVSTVLTLLVVPVMYTLFDDFGRRISGRFSQRKKIQANV
jgi:HAE1 family hydrophobic/amphiphilic exporter-1